MASTSSKECQRLLAQKDEVIIKLQKENLELKSENWKLTTRIECARGVPVERLIAEWTEGTIQPYKHSHDITTKNGKLLEVKYSKIHTQKTTRWVWDSLQGRNRTKKFNYLVLAGSKEGLHGYPDLQCEYVLFLIEQSAVSRIGNSVALNTNLRKARGLNAPLLIRHLVASRHEFDKFLKAAEPSAAPMPSKS
ncbi:MAG: hypothetical protein WBD19_19865 [Candidatus Acidiferrum sp.]